MKTEIGIIKSHRIGPGSCVTTRAAIRIPALVDVPNLSSRGPQAMKKLSNFHSDNKVLESESPATSIPNPTLTSSRPKGLQDREHPGHMTKGAAESHTDPIRDVKQTRRGSK